MTTVILLIAILVIIIGAALFRSNQNRFTNQVFSFGTLLLAAELILIHKAKEAGIRFVEDATSSPLPWIRASASLNAFFPWLLWLLCESIINPDRNRQRSLRRSLPWFLLGLALAIVALSNWYIPDNSTPLNLMHGPAYILLGGVQLSSYIFLIIRAAHKMHYQSGIRRLEMQFLVINLSVAAFLSLSLFAAGNILRVPLYKNLSIFSVLVAFLVTAWGVVYHHVFDLRQVLVSIVQRILLVVLLTCSFIFLKQITEDLFPFPGNAILSLGVTCSVAFWLDQISRQWLGLSGKRLLHEVRRAIIELARTEPKTEHLIMRFEELLCHQYRSRKAALLFERDHTYVSKHLSLHKRLPSHAALCEIGWVTPETLQRRRSSPALDDLRDFLAQHSLGLIITIPRGSPTPDLLLAFGSKISEAPFTYPEVEQLQNIAELMDNILIRARLNAQADLQARMEHLAMMSRGLAHDLKNLITPVSSFLMHTDGHYAAGSAEAEVHTAARRSMRVITDYVREAMFFAERLNPRFEKVHLPLILNAVYNVTAARAKSRAVTIETLCCASQPIIADAVLVQRLLTNLVHNAIDASSPGQCVRLSLSQPQPDQVRFEVSDQGCGISQDNLTRVFEPYFTTKVFGDEVRGFGLGLTICQTIADLHKGRIELHSETGIGTTVTVALPVTQEIAEASTRLVSLDSEPAPT